MRNPRRPGAVFDNGDAGELVVAVAVGLEAGSHRAKRGIPRPLIAKCAMSWAQRTKAVVGG